MSNKGKKLIRIPFTGQRKYVSKSIYKLWTKFTERLLPILAIISLIIALYLGFILGLVIRNNQPNSNDLVSPIVRAAEPTPTLVQPCYIPSKNTRKLMNKNPGFTGKLKQTYGECEWLYAAELIARESSFNPGAINPTSGACGLSQAFPCSKMKCELTDIDCQLRWIGDYVERRYGSFKKSIDFHNVNNWY